MIHVEEKLLMKQLMTGHFMNSIVMVEVDGKQVRTLPKDVAFHPVKDRPIHADFLRISKDAKVQVAVPVVFINEEASPGLKRGGRSEEHTSELQSLMRISYAVFCLNKQNSHIDYQTKKLSKPHQH